MNIQLLLNNALSVPVANSDEFNLNFSFNDFSPNPNILSDFSPEFYATADDVDAVNFINNWIVKYGIGQNIPAPAIDVDSGLEISNTFLNLADSGNQFDTKRGRIKVKLDVQNNTWFELADGLNLRNYYDESDFVKTRYVRESVPDYLESAILVIAIYVTVKELIQTVRDTIDTIKNSTPEGPTSFLIALKIALQILMLAIYVAAILLALYVMLKDLSEAIFGKPRAYYAVDVVDVITQGCNELGFAFESNTLDDLPGELTFMADTTEVGVLKKTPKNNPLPDISLLEFCNMIGLQFNLKLKAGIDKIVQFEHKSHFEQTPSNLALQDIWDKGTFAYNADDLYQAISLSYANAYTDGNVTDNKFTVMFLTDDVKENTNLSIPNDLLDSYTDVNTNIDSQRIYSNLKNKLDITLPFAAATRKNKDRPIEKVFNSIFDILTGINKDAKLKIGERKGLMVLQTDRVPVNMIYFRDGQKIAKNSEEFFKAKNIFNTYYQNETPFENQYVKHSSRGQEPLFNEETALQIINNNVARNEEGRTVTITKNIRNSRTNLYEFEYMMKLQAGDFGFIEDKNFEVIVVEDTEPERKKFNWKEFWAYMQG